MYEQGAQFSKRDYINAIRLLEHSMPSYDSDKLSAHIEAVGSYFSKDSVQCVELEGNVVSLIIIIYSKLVTSLLHCIKRHSLLLDIQHNYTPKSNDFNLRHGKQYSPLKQPMMNIITQGLNYMSVYPFFLAPRAKQVCYFCINSQYGQGLHHSI